MAAGDIVYASDFPVLPADVTAFVAASMTVTSTTYAALSTPLSAAITNPSSLYNMITDVVITAWMANDTANELTATFALSGGMTVAAGSGILASSELLLSRGVITATEHQVTVPITIPAGAASVTVAVQARRSTASGTQSFNQPTLRVRPVRFILP